MEMFYVSVTRLSHGNVKSRKLRPTIVKAVLGEGSQITPEKQQSVKKLYIFPQSFYLQSDMLQENQPSKTFTKA